MTGESKAETFEISVVKALPSSEHCLGHGCDLTDRWWMENDGAEDLIHEVVSACHGVRVLWWWLVGGCHGAMIRLEFKPLSLRSSQRARMTDAYRALAVE
jgi:hypothetical protein